MYRYSVAWSQETPKDFGFDNYCNCYSVNINRPNYVRCAFSFKVVQVVEHLTETSNPTYSQNALRPLVVNIHSNCYSHFLPKFLAEQICSNAVKNIRNFEAN